MNEPSGLFHIMHTKLVLSHISHSNHRLANHTHQFNITMVQELSYTVTNSVLESWEQMRRIKNYEQVAGVKLFQK